MVALASNPASADSGPVEAMHSPSVGAIGHANGYRVAVIVAGVVNVDSAEALELGERLARTLERRLEVTATSGQSTTPGLEAGRIAGPCVAEAGCLAELIARLRVDELLVLNIAKIGHQLRIEVARFRVGDDRAVSLAPIESDGEPTAAMASAAPRLLPSAKLRDTRKLESQSLGAPTLVLAATSALSLAVAGGFGIAAWREHDTLSERCGQRVCGDSSFKALRARRLTADIALGVGVVSGVAALVLWLRRGDGERPLIGSGPGDVGASWVTEF